jgi:hypothetical protein
MPRFEIQTGEGRFEVEAPTEDAAVAALTGASSSSPETTLAGVGKAAWSGLREGAAGLAGLPADAINLVGQMAGRGDQTAQFAKDYGSEAMRGRIEGATGEMYQPQTGVESVVNTAFSFAPGVIGGGASLPVKLATRMALPAAAAEGAKALTAGTAAEPYAPIAGGLFGLAGGMGIERAITRPAVAARPTRADIAKRTDDLYESADLKNVVVKPAPVASFVDDLKVRIDRDIASDFDAERTFKVLDKLKTDKPVRLEDIDRIRKRLGNSDYAGQTADFKPTPNARAAMEARSAIDDFLANLQQPQLVAGDAQVAAPILREAQKTAHVGFKMDKIARWLRDAEIDAAKSHSGGNLENVIYQKIAGALKRPEKELRGWSKEEIAALKRVLPNMAESILRRSSKFLGGGGGLGQYGVAAGGAAAFGPLGAIGLPAAGMALNKAGSAIASRKLNNVTDILAANTPMYAANRPAFQQSLQGPGLLGNLPSPAQGSLYAALMAQRPQPVQ